MKCDAKIEELIDAEQWRKARKLIMKALTAEPNHHWLLTRLALTYYEERKYARALEISQRAAAVAPDCPLVLWDLAGALEMNARERAAIEVWAKLLKRGVESLSSGECGEGIRWAKSLLNDCRYRIGRCYGELGDRRRARKYLQQHLDGRCRGVPSSYGIRDVRRDVERLVSKGRDHRGHPSKAHCQQT